MIQLTKVGLVGAANLKELAQQFEQFQTFRLSRLLHPELMRLISARLEHCSWITHDDREIAKEEVPWDIAPASVLNFAANTPEFLDMIRFITGCHQIRWFAGRVYRMVPSANHFDSWHADIGNTHKDRLVGMSINLGRLPYQGGILLIRAEASGKILCELPNTGQGDAIFFRISSELKHMVTALEGAEPKTAFAGWFRSADADFYSTLRPTSAV